MGWIPVILSCIAAFLMFKTSHTLMMILAIIAAVGCFWSWGIMHNYATELAKRRINYTGGFYDLTPQEIQAVPNWITWINMGFAFMGVILLIVGFIRFMMIGVNGILFHIYGLPYILGMYAGTFIRNGFFTRLVNMLCKSKMDIKTASILSFIIAGLLDVIICLLGNTPLTYIAIYDIPTLTIFLIYDIYIKPSRKLKHNNSDNMKTSPSIDRGDKIRNNRTERSGIGKIKLAELQNNYRGTKFYQLIKRHLKSKRYGINKTEQLQAAILGTIDFLPLEVQPIAINFVDRWNTMAYDADFWQTDTSYILTAIIDDARKILEEHKIEPNDDVLFNMFQIVVLSYAYSASLQPKMQEFMGIKKT